MNRRRRGPAQLGAASLAAVLLGCGVSSQSQPVPLPVQTTPALPTARSEQNGYAAGQLHTVDGSDLCRVHVPPSSFPVDAHVKNLRRKLGACGEQLETVRGVGYRVRP